MAQSRNNAKFGGIVPSTTPTKGQTIVYSGTGFEYVPTSSFGGGGSGVSDHGLLTGLSDNDHPQYLLRSAASGSVINNNSSVSGLTVSNALDGLQASINALSVGAQPINIEEETVTLNGSQTTASFSTLTTSNAEFYVEGVRLNTTEYSIINTSTISLVSTYSSGSKLTGCKRTGVADSSTTSTLVSNLSTVSGSTVTAALDTLKAKVLPTFDSGKLLTNNGSTASWVSKSPIVTNLYGNSGQSLNAGGILIYTTVISDTSSSYNTSNGQYTVSVNGVLSVSHHPATGSSASNIN